jgi:hypothetical protein
MVEEEDWSGSVIPLKDARLLAVALKARSPATTTPAWRTTSAVVKGGESDDNGPGSGLRRYRSSNRSTSGR